MFAEAVGGESVEDAFGGDGGLVEDGAEVGADGDGAGADFFGGVCGEGDVFVSDGFGGEAEGFFGADAGEEADGDVVVTGGVFCGVEEVGGLVEGEDLRFGFGEFDGFDFFDGVFCDVFFVYAPVEEGGEGSMCVVALVWGEGGGPLFYGLGGEF